LSTKIAALADALGNPVELMLAPGQDHDLTCAEPLLENVDPAALIADKAFGADQLISSSSSVTLPGDSPRANRKEPRVCDYALYRERNLIEHSSTK